MLFITDGNWANTHALPLFPYCTDNRCG